MPYSAGTAYLQVTPSFKNIEGLLAKEAAKIGQEVNKAVRPAITAAVTGGLQDAAKDVEQEAEHVGEAFADAFSGAFASRFHGQIEKAFKAIPKLEIEGLAGTAAEIEAVRADLESLHGQHIGIDIDERSAIAAFENMHERIRQLRQDLELNPNSDLADIHNLRVADAQLEALAHTVDDARRYGYLAGDEYGGAFANEVRRRIGNALNALPDLKITADSSDVERALAALRGHLSDLRNVRVGVDVDEAELLAKVKFLDAQLEELGKHTVSPKIKFDIEATRAQLRGLIDTVMPEEAQHAVEAFSDAFSGDFAKTFHQRLQQAFQSVPKIDLSVAGVGDVQRAIEMVRADLESLHGQHIGIDIDERSAIAAFENIFNHVKQLQHELELDPNSSLADVHNVNVMRGYLESLQGTIEQARRYGYLAGEEYGGAFADQARRRIDAAMKALPDVQIKADSTDAERAVAALRAQLAEMRNVRIGVDLDEGEFLAKLAFIEAQLEELGKHGASQKLLFDTNAARDELVKFRDTVVPPVAEETGNTYGGAFADQVGRRLTAAMKALPNIELTTDTSGTDFAFAAIRREIEDLSGKTIGIDVDEGRALERLAVLKGWLDEIARDDPNVRVKVEAAAASAELLAVLKLAKMVDDTDPKVKVKAEGGETAAEQLDALANAAAFGGSRLGYLVAISLTLGTVLVPAAAGAAVAIGALGTAIGGVAAGVGVAILGFSGIIGAVQALNKYQQDTSKSAASLTTSQNTLSGALDSVQSAERSLANTREQIAYQEKKAAQSVVDAQRSVVDAQRQARQAVLDLNQAYQEARRAEEDRVLALKDNALAQRQANLDIAQAKKDLDAVMNNPAATQAEREQAQITYQQRLLQLERLKVEGQRQQEDEAKAQKAGIAGSQQVVAAQDKVRQANEAVAQAQQRYADAVEQQRQQQRQGEYQLAQAAQAVASAQRQVEQASTRAGVAGGAAMQNLQTAMGNLSPAGQRFATFLFGLKADFLGIRQAAEEGMLPGVQRAIEMLMPYFPRLKAFVGEVASALGGLAVDFVGQLENPVWQHFFGFLANSAVPALKGVYTFSMNVAQGLASIFLALTPFNHQIGGGLIDMSEHFAKWADALSKSSGYHEFLDYVQRTGPKVLNLLSQLGQLAIKIVEAAAPVGEKVVGILASIADWLNSWPTGIFEYLLGGFASLMAIVLPLTGVLKVYEIAVNSVKGAKLAWGAATTVLNGILGIFGLQLGTAKTATEAFEVSISNVEVSTGKSKAALSGFSSFLAGPWGVAIAIATIGLGIFTAAQAEQKAKLNELQSAMKSYGDALKGGFNKDSTAAAQNILAQNEALRGLVDATKRAGISQETVVRGLNGDAAARKVVIDALEEQRRNEIITASYLRHGADAETLASQKHVDRANALEQLRIAFAKQNTANAEANRLTDELNEEMRKSPAVIKDVHDAMLITATSADTFSNAIKEVGQSGVDTSIKMGTLEMLAERVSTSHFDAATQAGLFRDVLGQIGSAVTLNGPTFDALSGAFDAIANSALSANDKSALLKQTLDQLYQSSINQNEAQEALVRTQGDLSTQLANNSAGFDLKTAKTDADKDAVLRNRDALEAALQSTRDSFIANIAQGDSLELATQKHDAQIKAIEAEIPKTQLNSQVVQDLVTTYGGIPGSVETEFKTSNVQAVYDQLQSLEIAQFALANGLTPEEAEKQWELSHSKAEHAFRVNGHGPMLMADGGLVPGWSPHKRADNIFSMLTADEFVQPVDTVDFYGVDVMEAIRRRTIPRELLAAFAGGGYADGGLVHPVFHGLPFVGGAQHGPDTKMPINFLLKVAMPTMAEIQSRFYSGNGTGGPAGAGQLGAWISQALQIAGLPASWGAPLRVLVMRESSGNPNAVNLWDANYFAGHPSKGLAQVIDPTFQQYRDTRLPNNPYDPVANLVAALHYIVARYHSIFNVQQANPNLPPKGYAFGGLVEPSITQLNSMWQPRLFDEGGLLTPGWNPPIWNGTGTVEPVLNPQQWSDIQQAAALNSAPPVGGDTFNFEFANTTLDESKLQSFQDRQAAKARVGRPR